MLPEEVVGLIGHARLEYGAPRTRIWLRRVHRGTVSLAIIQRSFRRLGPGRLPRGPKRPRKPRQLKLFEKAEPGESVQVDVKVVKIEGRKAFQYTALDDCSTRDRVLRLYPGRTSGRAEFLGDLMRPSVPQSPGSTTRSSGAARSSRRSSPRRRALQA